MSNTIIGEKVLNDAHLKQQLQILRQADNWTNLYYIAMIYIYLAAVISSTLMFYYQRETWGLPFWLNIPVSILAIILIGAGQHQLTGLGHEGSHHSLFKTKKWNEFASDVFCMFPVYSSTHFYRLQHMAHHQFVNDPERDPDVSQLLSSGHWLGFPASPKKFYNFLLQQLWIPNLFKFMIIRAAYNSTGTDANPYVKKSTSKNKVAIRIAIAYVFSMIPVLAVITWLGNPITVVLSSLGIFVLFSTILLMLSKDCYQQAKIHPVFSAKTSTVMRLGYVTTVFTSLAVLHLTVDPWAPIYYFMLWLVPIFTSFSFFMILRQVVQHGNGDRGWITNTRVFFVNQFINFCVFPIGQDYHLPHHLYSTVPHYRLKKLHAILMEYPEYQKDAINVHGYFHSPETPQIHPTVVEVLGDNYASKNFRGVHIDNTVLDDNEVEDKEGIINTGEREKQKAEASAREKSML